jgi:D-inositol-3-phosphate glycosyltransferase
LAGVPPLKLRIGVIMYQTSSSKGQELVAQRMVSYFRRLGHQAYLITSLYHDGREIVTEDSLGERGYVEADDGELGIPIIRVGSFTSKWPPRRVSLKDVVHTLEEIVNHFQLNVLITHSTMWNGPEEVAKFVEWRRNIKELGGFQDPLVFCHMSHFQEPSARRYSLVERSFRMAWNRLSLRTILRVANLVLVVTPYEEKAKTKMGALREKCILFPGGVDDNAFIRFAASSPKELRQRFNLPADAKIVAYLGTIEERKNTMAILEVAGKLTGRKEIHFVIAGSGDSEYAERVTEKARGLSNLTCLGAIDEKEKVQLIETSYLNILLSKMEALGLTQLEFMFRGVPVITSGVGGQAWVVKDGKEGVHVNGPKDVEGAARAIIELVEDGSRRDKYSNSSKNRASQFTLTKLIGDFEQVLTREIEKESGLAELPTEARSTLSEPEVVARTWSHGTQKVVATNKRVFIQEGRFSRSTTEMKYSSISSIDHIRRYAWRTLLLGAFLSALMFIQHYVFPIVSRTLTSTIILTATNLLPSLRLQLQQIVASLWLVPILAATLLFLVRARKGYAINGPRRSYLFLPQSFKEAIQFIREEQDLLQSGQGGTPNVMVENIEEHGE